MRILQENGTNDTPLKYARSRGHTSLIVEFIKQVDDEDILRCLGWTVQSGKADAVKAVLETEKVPVNILIRGRTALFWAVTTYNKEVVKVLLEHGADPNVRCTPDGTNDNRIKIDSEVSFQSSYLTGLTAIHAFARSIGLKKIYGREKDVEDCLKLLVDAGADVNSKTGDGQTPLYYACQQRSSKSSWSDAFNATIKEGLVKLLLTHGADLNSATESGVTPLHEVSSWSYHSN